MIQMLLVVAQTFNMIFTLKISFFFLQEIHLKINIIIKPDLFINIQSFQILKEYQLEFCTTKKHIFKTSLQLNAFDQLPQTVPLQTLLMQQKLKSSNSLQNVQATCKSTFTMKNLKHVTILDITMSLFSPKVNRYKMWNICWKTKGNQNIAHKKEASHCPITDAHAPTRQLTQSDSQCRRRGKGKKHPVSSPMIVWSRIDPPYLVDAMPPPTTCTDSSLDAEPSSPIPT